MVGATELAKAFAVTPVSYDQAVTLAIGRSNVRKGRSSPSSPEWWAVGPTSYDPGTGPWTCTARGRHPGRGKHPETMTGTGLD